MFCPKCGAGNPDGARFCGTCGHGLDRTAPEPAPSAGRGISRSPVQPRRPEGEKVGGLGILFFCIPLVGAILYFVWKDEHPEKAKKACYLALGGMAFGVVMQVLMNLLQLLNKGR